MGKQLSKSWLVICLALFLLVAININRLLPYPQAKDLLIDMTPFLHNWKIQGEGVQTVLQGPLGGRQATHTATITYASLEGSLTQDIYQFRNCNNSENYYSEEFSRLTSAPNSDDGWIAFLPETEYDSEVAMYSYLSCEKSTFDPPMTGCSYIAQYGVYVVKVYGRWLDSSQVGEKEFQEILEGVSTKMSSWYGVCISG